MAEPRARPEREPFRSTAKIVERRVRPRKPFVYRRDRTTLVFQRSRDVVIATIALAATSPILLAASVAIYLEDRGPILFTQSRVGRFEKLFTIYKLRTMRVAECRDEASPVGSGDRRVTKIGAFLRKTSIDELPQLFNILRGDMTLVGPRPEMPFIVRRYARWQHLRHLRTPGLTGLWQITVRSTLPLDRFESTAIDLDYCAKSSFRYDVELIVRTFSAVFGTRGAY